MSDRKIDARAYIIDEPKGNIRAFASVSINDMVAIRGIRVFESEKGLFVTMPKSYDKKADRLHDTVVPLAGLRKDINRAVLREYKEQMSLLPEQQGYEKAAMAVADATETGEAKVDEAKADAIKVDEIKLDIHVFPLEDPAGSTKAFASVAIDDLVAIRGIRVVDGENGLFISMPQSEGRTGLYHDIAFPLSGDLRKAISEGVLEKFEAATAVERQPTLADRLAAGAEKAAAHVAPERAVPKARYAGVLE